MARERDEEEFLARYRPGDFPRPSVTVDIVVLTIVDAELRVLLVRRKEHPYKNRWALPGGFVRVGDGHRNQGEDLDAAAARELEEETGLAPRMAYLEQLRAFGRAGRDPRMRVITIAYYALVRPDYVPLVRAGGDAQEADWVSVSSLSRTPLAFDHADIVAAALAHTVRRLDDSDLLFNLVPPTFTIPELRSAREIVTGQPQDPGNFRRRFQRMIEDGIIERAPGKRITASKPAVVYRFRLQRAPAARGGPGRKRT
jgi:8-oxo-dGTP diphosphatase